MVFSAARAWLQAMTAAAATQTIHNKLCIVSPPWAGWSVRLARHCACPLSNRTLYQSVHQESPVTGLCFPVIDDEARQDTDGGANVRSAARAPRAAAPPMSAMNSRRRWTGSRRL